MLTNLFLGQTAEEKNFIEDLFSCYLYTGNGSTQTINNGIDLAGKGGMVWLKSRNVAGYNYVSDTDRGTLYQLVTSTSSAQQSSTSYVTAFNSNGFNLGASGNINNTNDTFASWTFRKAPKFFDVVTYTGNGSTANRAITHGLGSVPGMIIVKRSTGGTSDWIVYHRSLSSGNNLSLNSTSTSSANGYWSVAPTAADFTLSGMFGAGEPLNQSGSTYVAYLFAHDTTTDGVIQCGSFTTDASGDATVTLGWEPQYVLIKNTASAENWKVVDTMRGFSNPGNRTYDDNPLFPNTSAAETVQARIGFPTSTGFGVYEQFSSNNYIYLAIRRGPMRVPTDATKVFAPTTRLGNSTDTTITGIGFNPDFVFGRLRSSTIETSVFDRLRGTAQLFTQLTDAEGLAATVLAGFDVSDGIKVGTSARFNSSSVNCSLNYVARAPGFFDVVCYTASYSANPEIKHNLGVAPELVIAKSRTGTRAWYVAGSVLGGKWLNLNDSAGSFTSTAYTGTATYFKAQDLNWPDGSTHVAYLFASCPGVSKVGTYTGTGTTKQIDCGFTNGARFVLIKRTDSTGDWTVWDTARGIVSGNDPYLLLNSTAAEVTNTDYIDPLSTGFEISSTAPAAINANGGTFVFLAIA